MDIFLKSANDIFGVSDNLFTEDFLRAHLVTSRLPTQWSPKFKAKAKAWGHRQPFVCGHYTLQTP